MDNGASNEMKGHIEKIIELDNGAKGHVKFGSVVKVHIEGKGSIMFQVKTTIGARSLLHPKPM